GRRPAMNLRLKRRYVKLTTASVFIFVSLLILVGPSTLAQQIGNPSPQFGVNPPRGTFAIRNAHIITVSGADIENGSILIRDGKIEAVGASINIPAGA